MKSKLAALTLAVLGGLASTAYAGLFASNVQMSSQANLFNSNTGADGFGRSAVNTALNGSIVDSYSSNNNTDHWSGPWEVHATATNTSILAADTLLLDVASTFGSQASNNTYVKSWGGASNSASASFTVDTPASYRFTMSCSANTYYVFLSGLSYTLKDNGSTVLAGTWDNSGTPIGDLALTSGDITTYYFVGSLGYSTDVTLLPGHSYSLTLNDTALARDNYGPQLTIDSYVRLDFLNAVPEPSSTFALALPLAGVLLRRRASSRA